MEKTLSSLEFDIYLHLLIDVLGKQIESFSICDIQNNTLWEKLSIEKQLIEKSIKLFDANKNTAVQGTNKNVETLYLPDNKILYCAKLQNFLEIDIGYLLIKTQANEEKQNHLSSALVSGLINYIVEAIQHEYKLTSELDSMANELAQRYDELNLLYDSEQEIPGSKGIDHRLQELLNNCVNYLDIEVVCLIVPEKSISIIYNNPNESSLIFSNLIEELKNLIYTKLIINKSSIIINNNYDAIGGYSDIAGKVLASPIIDNDGYVTGALIIIKAISKIDFSNSDKNLLEVISMKVSKIIQENFDSLTGLLNRTVYEEKISDFLKDSYEQESCHCILNIDIDDLQVINDTASYQTGDKLIHQIATLLKEQISDTDIIARIGGDDFGILLKNCSLEKASSIAEMISQSVSCKYFIVDGKHFKITISIGIAPINKESESIANVLSAVEVACSAAKDSGKNSIQIYQQENYEIISRKEEMKWVSRIQSALETNKFQLYCQIIEPLQTKPEILNIEILLRLKDDDETILTPWSFIPAAERFNLMPEIDRWVVEEALKQLSQYCPKLKSNQGKIAINLSGQTLGAKNFLNFVIEKVNHADIPAENICFEVTESAAIANLENAKHFISELRNKGFRFSLDDFGTGLSSFAYLKSLKVDYLKIDGSFVKEIVGDPIAEAMVIAINQVGHVMGLKTIAEFVENDVIKAKLKTMGIDYAQGYAINKPEPLHHVLKRLSEKNYNK